MNGEKSGSLPVLIRWLDVKIGHIPENRRQNRRTLDSVFSDFELRFFIVFSSTLRKFWVSGARWGRFLPESEERIEKCVDTAENEPRQKWENFDAFSNKKTRQNLFFSKLNFFDADRAENWHSFNWDVVEWPQQFSARSVTMCVENLKFDSFLFTY